MVFELLPDYVDSTVIYKVIDTPEKIRLQYRLDSVDSEWLDTSHPAHAIYSNIPAGKHAFHVRACNRDGILRKRRIRDCGSVVHQML